MKRDAPDPLDVQRFQSAVDHRLSGLREDPFLARRILANEKREKKVKKRMSLGLVMALTLIFVMSAVLTENWPAVTDYLAGVGLPDRIVQPLAAGNKENEAADPVIERYVIEPVSAPVRLHFLNDEGEEAGVFDIMPQVAQVEYHYILRRGTDGVWTVEQQIAVSEPEQRDKTLAASPFEPYLFVSGFIASPEYDSSVTDDSYTLSFQKARYRLTYKSEIYLNEQGIIVGTEEDVMGGNCGLTDCNGTIPINCFESLTAISSDPGIEKQSTPTPLPVAAASPLPVQTATLPPESAAVSIPMNYGQLRGEYSNSLHFGLPYTLHYLDKDGNPHESYIDTCDNMLAVLDPGDYAEGLDLGGKNGEVLTEYGLLILLGCQQDTDVTFQRIEVPTVTAVYEEGGYTVRVTGGKFRVQYPTDVYYETEAQLYEDGSWHYTPTSDNFLSADYAVGEYAYDFTFRLKNQPEQAEKEPPNGLHEKPPEAEYYDTLLFGAPVVRHYTGPNGDVYDLPDNNCEVMSAHFNRQQFENLADFGKQDGPVKTEYELLLVNVKNGDMYGTFTELEKPDMYVSYAGDGYTVRFTGGKFRVKYPTDLYFSSEACRTTPGGRVTFTASPAYLIRAEYATGEYPYDFTFHLMNPLDYHTTETFGEDFPAVTHYYIEPDGTIKTWEQSVNHFEANLQEQAVTRLVDLSQSEQILEYQNDFISFRSMLIPELPMVTVLEKPQCVVTPATNGYEMRVTGGLLRIRYNNQIWRKEAADGTIMGLASPNAEESYTTVEIPFDFTFTVPVYEEPLWEG